MLTRHICTTIFMTFSLYILHTVVGYACCSFLLFLFFSLFVHKVRSHVRCTGLTEFTQSLLHVCSRRIYVIHIEQEQRTVHIRRNSQYRNSKKCCCFSIINDLSQTMITKLHNDFFYFYHFVASY